MKKIVSFYLSLVMCLMPFRAIANAESIDKASAEYTNPIADTLLEEAVAYDTSVYDGAKAYLMQDTFACVSNVEGLGMPSGWDLDKRGGSMSGRENIQFIIDDSSDRYPVSMTKQLMTHKSGKVTFETAFVMQEFEKSGYSYTLTGLDKTIFRIETVDNKLCVLNDGKLEAICEYESDKIIPVKAELDFDTKKYELYIGGRLYGSYPFAEDARQLDRITVSTSDYETMSVLLRYIYIYINFIVHETFMASDEGSVPDWWSMETDSVGSEIVYDANQVYPDLFSFELDDRTSIDGIKLQRSFEPQKNKIAFESKFILTDKTDSVSIVLGEDKTKAVSVNIDKDSFKMGTGEFLRENYKENLWYSLKIIADVPSKTADVYLNYQKILEGIKFENNVNVLNSISFETGVKKVTNMRVDDIYVYEIIPQPEDYVPKPEPVLPEGDLHVGMQMYSMWNEGNHFGWDWITAYPDRIPYIGLYNEGSKEVADWFIKWQSEHGIDVQINIFSRAAANINNPVKLPTRYHYLYNGYFESEYRDAQKMAIMYTTIGTNTLGGVEDFRNNVIPYLIENFFKQPNYLLKDNKPVLFMYPGSAFVSLMGGIEAANQAIEDLNEECINNGFDGIIVVPDGQEGAFIGTAPSFAQKYAYSYGWQYEARNSTTQLMANDSYFARDLNVVGSVSMGWGKNPWGSQYNHSIFAEPEEIKKTIEGIRQRFTQIENPTNLIALTCWDEYGEGHFYNPTRVHGFEYLNAIKEAVTGMPAYSEEAMPSAKAIARMNSLYPGNRRALKMVPDKPLPALPDMNVDESRLEVLAEWDFEKANDLLGWKIDKQCENLRIEDGALVAEATDADPGIWVEGVNIPADMVKIVRITAKTDGLGKGVFYYQTDVDTEMGVQGKRFEITQISKDWTTYTGYAYDKKKLQGTITAVRWDPQDKGYPNYKKFGVKKIQILGYKDEELAAESELPAEKYTIKFNGAVQPEMTAPVMKDGTMFISCNRLLYDMSIKTVWNWGKKTYRIETDDKNIELTVGSNIMKVNGAEVDIKYAPYYDYGHLMVPARAVLEATGAEVIWDGADKSVNVVKVDKSDAYPYQENTDGNALFTYMFETRNDTEGWTTNGHITSMKLEKGMLAIKSGGNDPFITSEKMIMNTAEYKYMRLRMKNTSKYTGTVLFFVTETEKSWGNGKKYVINSSAKDTEIKEYIVELDSNEQWTGNVTQFRLDPIDNIGKESGNGTIYIDSIEFLEEIDE